MARSTSAQLEWLLSREDWGNLDDALYRGVQPGETAGSQELKPYPPVGTLDYNRK
jgi:hypothetical protein